MFKYQSYIIVIYCNTFDRLTDLYSITLGYCPSSFKEYEFVICCRHCFGISHITNLWNYTVFKIKTADQLITFFFPCCSKIIKCNSALYIDSIYHEIAYHQILSVSRKRNVHWISVLACSHFDTYQFLLCRII